MSWRKELQEIRRERDRLIRRDEKLRTDLRWQTFQALTLLQLAGQVIALVNRLVGGRRARRR